MVDGGTLWTDGPPILPERPDGPTPTTGPTDAGGPFGRFAQIECFDYPFYNTLDVDFYASFARLQLWPELERAVIREFARLGRRGRPGDRRRSSGAASSPRGSAPGALPHDVGGPLDDPLLRVNAYRYQDINIWKDLELQVRPPALARRDGPGRRGAAPRRVAGIVRALTTSRRSTGTATGCPSTTATPTRPTTRGR